MERSQVFASRMHDVAPRDVPDRVILLVAFAAGVFGGLLLKLLGTHPFIASLFAAGVLVAYAILAYGTTRLRLEPEQVGDNCYYLGFLFTLTSLAVTLYFVVESGVDRRAELIPAVISGFGVALSSTIVGVFLRVMMMQVRVDIVAGEKEVRVEMTDAARRLRTEMAQSIRQVKAFTIESLQHSREREEAMRRTTDGMIEDFRRIMEDSAQITNKAIGDAVHQQVTEGLARIGAVVGTASAEILERAREGTTALKQQGDALAAERAGTEADLARFHDIMERLGSDVALSGRRLAEEISAAARDQTAAAMEGISGVVGAASKKILSGASSNLTDLRDEARRTGESALVTNQAMLDAMQEQMTTGLASIRTSVERAAAEILEQARMGAGALRDEGRALAAAQTRTEEGFVRFRETMDRLGAEVSLGGQRLAEEIGASVRDQTAAAMQGISGVVGSASKEILAAATRDLTDLRGEAAQIGEARQKAGQEILGAGGFMDRATAELTARSERLSRAAEAAARESDLALARFEELTLRAGMLAQAEPLSAVRTSHAPVPKPGADFGMAFPARGGGLVDLRTHHSDERKA